MRSRFVRSMSVLLLIAVAGMGSGLAGCAAGRQSSLPTPEELAAPGAGLSGADGNALRRGRAIFVSECAACHRLFWPHEYSPEQWRPLAKRMGRRASLSEGQIADLTAYLTAASRAGK